MRQALSTSATNAGRYKELVVMCSPGTALLSSLPAHKAPVLGASHGFRNHFGAKIR